MEISLPSTLRCQKDQPLQDGAPCRWAPTWWIEPLKSVVMSVPSARTLARQRLSGPCSTVPGSSRPCSMSQPKGMRGSLRLAGVRSEEHTSELQSLMRISYAVFCLKKIKNYNSHTPQQATN